MAADYSLSLRFFDPRSYDSNILENIEFDIKNGLLDSRRILHPLTRETLTDIVIGTEPGKHKDKGTFYIDLRTIDRKLKFWSNPDYLKIGMTTNNNIYVYPTGDNTLISYDSNKHNNVLQLDKESSGIEYILFSKPGYYDPRLNISVRKK